MTKRVYNNSKSRLKYFIILSRLYRRWSLITLTRVIVISVISLIEDDLFHKQYTNEDWFVRLQIVVWNNAPFHYTDDQILV